MIRLGLSLDSDMLTLDKSSRGRTMCMLSAIAMTTRLGRALGMSLAVPIRARRALITITWPTTWTVSLLASNARSRPLD